MATIESDRCSSLTSKRPTNVPPTRLATSVPSATTIGEEDQRDDARRARRVPEVGRGEGDHARLLSSGQPPTNSTEPSWRTRRADHPAWAMWYAASSPHSSAAVAKALAITQSASITVAVAYGPLALSPVRGSMM